MSPPFVLLKSKVNIKRCIGDICVNILLHFKDSFSSKSNKHQLLDDMEFREFKK